MPLSYVEKQAGRAFRDARQEALNTRNVQEPPGVVVMTFWRVVRHECPAANGVSTGITLREVCELSPEYLACYCSAFGPASPDFPHDDCDGSSVISAAGQFAFIWKEGKCSGAGCGLLARARRGRFVIAADRLPDHGRTHGERQTSPHHRDPRLPRA